MPLLHRLFDIVGSIERASTVPVRNVEGQGMDRLQLSSAAAFAQRRCAPHKKRL
jgi:hypothetical protein